MKTGTIKKAWKESGLHPFNPDIVLVKISQKTPPEKVMDPVSPPYYRDISTPKKRTDVDRMHEGYQLHFISANTAIRDGRGKFT